MEKQKNSFLERLAKMGLIQASPDDNIHYIFNPNDYSIMRLSWNSPNDGLGNVINFSMDPRKYKTVEIRDNH